MHSQNINSPARKVACKKASKKPGNQELSKNVIGNTGSENKLLINFICILIYITKIK